MSYFKNFGLVEYRFGNEDESQRILVEDLSIYVDLLEQIDDLIGFYEYYDILDGDRPDTLSYKIYGTTDYYWTFYLMNPFLKETGWPLHQKNLDEYTVKKFSGATYTPGSGVEWRDPIYRVETGYGPLRFSLGSVTSSKTNVVVNVTGNEDPLLDNQIPINDATGIVSGYNISGLYIPNGTTITAVDYGNNILYLSTNTTDDYEAVDGVVNPPLTCWDGNAYQLHVNSTSVDIREGDIVRGSGILNDSQGPTYVTSFKNNIITLSRPATQPYTSGDTFQIYGPMEAYRNWDLAQVTLKSTNRSGKEFHEYIPFSEYYDDEYESKVYPYDTTGIVIEPEATHHYENSSGEWIDAVFTSTNPYGTSPLFLDKPGGLDVEVPPSSSVVTNREYMQESNDVARRIRVIKPDVITRVVNEFQRLVKG